MKLNLNLYKFQKKKLINFRLYRNFKKKFSNEEIYRVKNILLDININYEPLLYFKHLDINKSFVNNYLKQKLYKDLINKSEFEIDLIKFFLFKKKITVSLSNLHINYLRQNNIKVNTLISSLNFFYYILFSYIKTFVLFFKILFLNKQLINNKFTYFVSSEDINKKKLKFNYPDINIYPIVNDKLFIKVTGFYNIINYIFKSLLILLNTTYALIKFDLFNVIIAPEIIKLEAIKLIQKDKLPINYFFTQSILKPLWVNYIEKYFNVYFFFYSLNIMSLFNTKNDTLPYGYKLMSWNKYLTWNKNHSKWLRDLFPNNQIDIIKVGPIFLDNDLGFQKENEKKIISIFDIPPLRPINYEKYIIPGGNFYNLNNSVNFIKDILFVNEICKQDLVVKPKRYNEKIYSKKYYNFLKLNNNKIKFLNSNTSISEIIKKSKLVICMPYTSIYLIAKYYDVPVVFYNPTDILIKKNILFGDISVINSKKDLISWVEKNL